MLVRLPKRDMSLYAACMGKTCAMCPELLDVLAPGRIRSTCSDRCRKAKSRAARAESIPAELRDRDRWVRWTLTRGPKPRKRPIQVDGSSASSTDQSTWASYAQVRAHARKGFALGAGIGCIDLDHCVVDGRPNEAASKFLSRLPRTYVEISPSGDGLHVFGFLEEGPGSRRVVDGLSVEVYSVGRYMTVTGDPLPGSVSRLADLTGVVP